MQTITPNGINKNTNFGFTSLILVSRSSFFSLMRTDLLNTFFNDKEFAENISYTHVTGEVVSYKAIFDEPFAGINPGTELEIGSLTPQIKLRQDGMKRAPMHGDAAIVRGVTYVVDNSKPDGTGVVVIYLNRRDRQ